MTEFDFKRAHQHIKEINAIVDTCPEALREKCFELLFQIVFRNDQAPKTPAKPLTYESEVEGQTSGAPEGEKTRQSEHKLPPSVMAFTRRHGISIADISKLFILDHEPLLPIYKIQSKTAAAGQLQKVMMVFLENALLNNQFKVPYEELRDTCKEEGFFDSNFNKMLKRQYGLFRGAITKDKITEIDTVELSGDGYERLSQTIRELGQTAQTA